VNAEDYLKRIFVAGTLLAAWLAYTDFNHQVLHPRNWTDTLLKLPWTEWSLYRNTYSTIHSVPALEWVLKKWYTLGFTSALIGSVAVFFAAGRPKDVDAELLGLAVMHTIVMLIYAFAFVYPPHIVYGFNPVKSPLMNLANHRFVFPSLHTALAVFLAMYFIWKEIHPVVKAIFTVNGFVIPFVTILLVQHWIYDAISGILLASFSFWVAKKYGKQFSQALDRWQPDKKLLIASTIALYVIDIGYTLLKVFRVVP